MKYLLTTIMTIGFAFTGVQAQEANKAPQEKTLSKEDKAAAKAKKEADLMIAFKTAGLTEEEQQKYRAIMEESSAFGKSLKADATLTDEQKAEKAKEYGKAKDGRIKDLLGVEKYKALKEVQKSQFLRMVDVLFLGPLMIYAGSQLESKSLKSLMIISGSLVMANNLRNYIETKNLKAS
jgi:hypothetical protein